MSVIPEIYLHVAALVVVTTAAAFDWRTGRIPNWITLPPLAVAPLVHGITGGMFELGSSLIAIFACGLVPWVLFKKEAAGGGDVKLFAAIGAITGLRLGIEAEFFTFLVVAVFSLGQLAWHGKFFRTLSNAFFLGLNPIMPVKWRREIKPELMTMVRVGMSAVVGTGLAVLFEYPGLWMGSR